MNINLPRFDFKEKFAVTISVLKNEIIVINTKRHIFKMVKEVIINQFISWMKSGFEYFYFVLLRISLGACTINVSLSFSLIISFYKNAFVPLSRLLFRCYRVSERFDNAIPSK